MSDPICDAIDEAEDADEIVQRPPFVRTLERIQEVETAMLQMADDLKYPVDHRGHVLDMNHLPDVPHCLAYHLVRRGWRQIPDKALIKPRPVVGAGFYQDLVTYVPVDQPDEPVVVPKPDMGQQWSVRPIVNVIDEERPE